MSDLISRQVAIDSLTEIIMNLKNVYGDMGSAVNGARECIKSLPFTEPEQQKKGEWMLYESRSDIYDLEGVCTWGRAYRCSECGFIHWVIEDFGIYSFCPNCGADMRGTL